MSIKKLPSSFFWILFVFVLFLPVFSLFGDVSELIISPNSPRQGDNVTFLIAGPPGEEVEVSVLYKKNVEVIENQYNWRLEDVYVPYTPNSISVKATGIEIIHISVELMVWVTKSVEAVLGKAELSQVNVPKGTFDVWLHGDAVSNVSEVILEIKAKTTITIGSNGIFVYTYNTNNIPVGNFTVQVGEISRGVNLGAPNIIDSNDNTPPSFTSHSPTDVINTSSTIINVNYTDVSGIDIDSINFHFNGVEVEDTFNATIDSVNYFTETLENGTLNHIELWISDIHGNEGFLEWNFTVSIPAPDTGIGKNGQYTNYLYVVSIVAIIIILFISKRARISTIISTVVYGTISINLDIMVRLFPDFSFGMSSTKITSKSNSSSPKKS